MEGARPFNTVRDTAQSAGWDLVDFHVERGRMDDVFRQITLGNGTVTSGNTGKEMA
jgi:hypothetical protein